jgi:hypothetical protein
MTRPRDATTAALIVIALLASASATLAAGTPEQRRACRADAMRLCREFVPNVARITACMERNIDKLSPLCRKQFK